MEALLVDGGFYLEKWDKTKPGVACVRQTDGAIFAGAWYRQLLGLQGRQIPREVQLEIKVPRGQAWLSMVGYPAHHPQVLVRVAAMLGLIGVALGLLGIGFAVLGTGLGILGLVTASTASHDSLSAWTMTAYICVGVGIVLSLFSLGFVVRGLMGLARR